MCADKQSCSFGVTSQYVDLAVEVFRLLSDATRVKIVLVLKEGERSVTQIAAAVGKSPTAVSQHLAKLRWGKIVQARQDGTHVYYSLIDEHASQLVNHAVFQAEHVVGGMPPHHTEPDGTITSTQDPS